MADKRISSSAVINRFLREVKKDISIERIILFGSYAGNRNRKWSDIDLAVISNDFRDVDYFERLVILGKLAWRAKATPVEALGFTPDEYRRASKLDFLGEIKKKGKTIYHHEAQK